MLEKTLRRFGVVVVVVALLGALTGCRTMPTSGRYSTQLYTDAQLTTVSNIVYRTVQNSQGQTVQLALDLYLPPADDGPVLRPMVIAIHGGGFTSGSRSQMATVARTYARRGFVAATISYRLDPGASMSDLPRYLTAVTNAIDDGMESVRWARSVASTYSIDTSRIAMVGSSAGGVIAMGTAVMPDTSPGGPYADHSPKIASAVATGVNLTIGFDLGVLTLVPDPAPIHMFHYTTDDVTGDSIDTAFQTCVHVGAAGGKCSLFHNQGTGHTINLGAGATHWASEVGPYLWSDLDLYALVPA